MTEIISVRFRSGGKEYYFDPKGIKVKPGTRSSSRPPRVPNSAPAAGEIP